MTIQTANLRQSLRKQRKGLNQFQQRIFERASLQKIYQYPHFKSAQKIGIYLDAFGEIRTQKLIELCFTLHKSIYLPMICNMNQRLVWVKISKQLYRNNRFSKHSLGMLEPMASRGLHVSHLDLLIMPLLACDRYGTRMGMGGGFYDRTLASSPHKPYRLGLGHNFQYLDQHLKRHVWDQALDGFICPAKSYFFKRSPLKINNTR